MNPFLTVEELELLFRPLTDDEKAKAEAVIPLVSDALRQEAKRMKMDLDALAQDDASYASTLKLVTNDIVQRVIRQSTTGDPLSQETQGALGYSWSGTFAVPGGGVAQAIMRNDLKRLGIRRQKYGFIEIGKKGEK